jgi:N-acetylmuramoyl-L-alanine amidase
VPTAAGLSIDSLPIPASDGALGLKVVHPQPNATITAGDSTFLLGTVGTGAAKLLVDGRPVEVHPNGAWLAWIRIPPDSAFSVAFEATTASDTVRDLLPLQRPGPSTQSAILDSLARGIFSDTSRVSVRLDDDPSDTGTTDSLIIGRNLPGGTYTWFFTRGTQAVAVGRLAGMVRLRLSEGTHAWVPASEVVPLPEGTPPPFAAVGSLKVERAAFGVTIRVPLGARVPVSLTETAESITITVHGAAGDINWTRYAPGDALVRRIDWSQEADRVVLEVQLARPLWGYRSRWHGGDLLVDIRTPPCPQRDDPFRGRSIALDPGHPPAGATGPTGLTEAEANLAIALRLRTYLDHSGAQVFLTRTDGVPLDLTQRVRLAEAAGAEILVSIHNNALPDGVNPFTGHGSSVFYNHAPSLPLARAVQDALVRRLGVRDLGVGRGDLALVRPTWQPAILTEGLFMIVPAHEAALRRDAGQDRYALGVYDGLRGFLAAQGAACEKTAR